MQFFDSEYSRVWQAEVLFLIGLNILPASYPSITLSFRLLVLCPDKNESSYDCVTPYSKLQEIG